MAQWLVGLDRSIGTELSETEAIGTYARLHLGFVHIHSFWDGNGRLARLRLVSNILMLRSSHLPLVIDNRDRKGYIDALASYEQESSQLIATTGVWPSRASDAAFRAFCQRSYRVTRNLIEQAKTRQAERATGARSTG